MTFIKFHQSGTIALAALLLAPTVTLAAPAPGLVVRKAAGTNPASIQSTVNSFRADLGGKDNGVGGSFSNGRREINWDAVPDNRSAPNNLPADFFNVTSPRGVVFSTPGQAVQVSGNAGVAPIEFDNINPTYSSIFRTFSPQRLFTAVGSNIVELAFFVPGTNTRATVSGFGAVFTDVDRWGSSKIEYFDAEGKLLFSSSVPNVSNKNESLSFLGVSFKKDNPIYRVRITSGNAPLSSANNDGGAKDIVSMDDFIFGEPQAKP